MSVPAADRDTLFGILAYRAGLVTLESLDAALGDRTRDVSRSLGQVLLDRGAITEPGRTILGALVDEHVRSHGGDATRSLASFETEVLTSWPPEYPFAPPRRGGGEPSTQASPDDGPTVDANPAGAAPGPGREPQTRPAPAAVRYLARGGLGDVFVAFDEELKREVALKQIREKNAHDPRIRSRFVAEAEITGHLEHPGVVPVYGLGCYEDGRPFYAMRFIQGVSLGAAIERFHAADADEGPAPLTGRCACGSSCGVSSTPATRSPTRTAGACCTAT